MVVFWLGGRGGGGGATAPLAPPLATAMNANHFIQRRRTTWKWSMIELKMLCALKLAKQVIVFFVNINHFLNRALMIWGPDLNSPKSTNWMCLNRNINNLLFTHLNRVRLSLSTAHSYPYRVPPPSSRDRRFYYFSYGPKGVGIFSVVADDSGPPVLPRPVYKFNHSILNLLGTLPWGWTPFPELASMLFIFSQWRLSLSQIVHEKRPQRLLPSPQQQSAGTGSGRQLQREADVYQWTADRPDRGARSRAAMRLHLHIRRHKLRESVLREIPGQQGWQWTLQVRKGTWARQNR